MLGEVLPTVRHGLVADEYVRRVYRPVLGEVTVDRVVSLIEDGNPLELSGLLRRRFR